MAPDGSWTAAMLFPVARTSAAVSTPGTAGTEGVRGGGNVAGAPVAGARGAGPTWAGFSRTGMRSLRAARVPPSAAGVPPSAGRAPAGAARPAGLTGVQHQALADERVQGPLGHPGG